MKEVLRSKDREPIEMLQDSNAPTQLWVQCDACMRWRMLPDGIQRESLPDKWFCNLHPIPSRSAILFFTYL